MDFDKIFVLVNTYGPKLLGALATLIIGFWLASFCSKVIKRVLIQREIDTTLVAFSASLINILIKVLVLLSAASMFGLQVTSFIAILGAAAFAVGLALQGNLSHLAAGVLILFFRPFRVGDFIVTQGYSGTVKEIQIFNTILVTIDNRVVIVPNGSITSAPLENLSANAFRKVPMKFGIAYSADIDKARAVIQEVANQCEWVDHTQAVDIIVTELADSSVNITVRPWCKTEDYWTVYAYMHEHIKKAFDSQGVSIPFPQMDVHVHK